MKSPRTSGCGDGPGVGAGGGGSTTGTTLDLFLQQDRQVGVWLGAALGQTSHGAGFGGALMSTGLIYRKSWSWVGVDPKIPFPGPIPASPSRTHPVLGHLLWYHLPGLTPCLQTLPVAHQGFPQGPRPQTPHRELSPSCRRLLPLPKSSQGNMVTKP